MADVYVSVDVETDGPIPGPHSMLSLGAAAFRKDQGVIATFSQNLVPLDGASPDPDTARWWASQPTAIRHAATDGALPASQVMAAFDGWARDLGGRPTFVAYPAGFDFTFVHWYLHRFVGGSPFSHSALDIKTLGMVALGVPYRAVSKQRLRAHFPVASRTAHVALDDAIEQAELCLALLRDLDRRLRV